MKNITFLTLLLLMLNHQLFAAIFINEPIEDEVEKAELIISGKLKNKTSGHEEHIRTFQVYKNYKDQAYTKIEEKEIKGDYIMTTFVFVIDEILKGHYEGSEITIKMLGGCTATECNYLTSNYDYKIGDTGLLFLKYDSKNNRFLTTNASHTAFKLNKITGKLIRGSNHFETEAETDLTRMLKKKNKSILTLETLKGVINDHNK